MLSVLYMFVGNVILNVVMVALFAWILYRAGRTSMLYAAGKDFPPVQDSTWTGTYIFRDEDSAYINHGLHPAGIFWDFIFVGLGMTVIVVFWPITIPAFGFVAILKYMRKQALGQQQIVDKLVQTKEI